jgi:biopolymer transport protein ExbB/TolQ
MWDKIISLIDALLIHAVFLAILLFSANLPKFSSPTPTTLEQSVVDESAVLEEIERLKREDEFKNATQQAQHYALEQKKIEYEQFVVQERVHLEDLHEEQEKEKQQLEALKQRRQAEAQALEKIRRDKALVSEQ